MDAYFKLWKGPLLALFITIAAEVLHLVTFQESPKIFIGPAGELIQKAYILGATGWGIFDVLTLLCVVGFGMLPLFNKVATNLVLLFEDIFALVLGTVFGFVIGSMFMLILGSVFEGLLGVVLGLALGGALGFELGNILGFALKGILPERFGNIRYSSIRSVRQKR